MGTTYGDRLNVEVASELRAWKARRLADYAYLVDTTGLSQRAIQRYLKGEREIPLPALATICAALNVDAADVLRAATISLAGRDAYRALREP